MILVSAVCDIAATSAAKIAADLVGGVGGEPRHDFISGTAEHCCSGTGIAVCEGRTCRSPCRCKSTGKRNNWKNTTVSLKIVPKCRQWLDLYRKMPFFGGGGVICVGVWGSCG